MTDRNPSAPDREDSASLVQEPGEPAEAVRASQTIVDPLARPDAREPAFESSDGQILPGQILADRFRVNRLLGRGGMGTVFAARDQKLGEAVALKVVRSGISNADEERQRLRREVQLARKVTHTNVCRIYDLFEHLDRHSGATLDLISMELLAGETLHEYRARQGTLSLEQALPITRQIARGLNAAHKLGIVHCDLKPGNVMLEQDEPAGLRAAITDFGLAKRIALEGPIDVTLASEGKLIGSPKYMAPEQVAAEPTSQATDVFGLGLLLFEMLSGHLPYTGNSPWQLALNRLQKPPESLTRYLPDIDPSILAVVDRCLMRDPQERFTSAIEFLDSLDRGDSAWNVYGHKHSDAEEAPEEPADSAEAEAPASNRQTPPPGAIAEARAVTREASEAVDASRSDASPPKEAPSEVSDRPERAAVSHRRRGDRISAEWRRPQKRAAALVAVGCLVFLAFQGWRPQVHTPTSTDAQMLDADREPLPSADGGELSTQPPPDALASRRAAQAAEALEGARTHLSVLDAEPARRILTAAIEASAPDPMLEMHLAQALWRLGEEQRLRPVIERAYGSSAAASDPEKRFIQALHQGFLGDWELATENLRCLWQAHPSLEAGLWIIEGSFNAGRFNALSQIVSGLRGLPGRDGQDPRIDLWHSRISQRLGNYEDAESSARRLVARAEEQSHRHLLFEGLLELYTSLHNLGRDLEARTALLAADRLARELDQPFVLAKVMRVKGKNFNINGYEQEALLELEQADAIYEQQGSIRGLCKTTFQHAIVTRPSDLVVARLERGLEACARGGYRLDEAWTHHHLARMARDTGDFARASDLFRRSAELMEHLGNDNGLAHSHLSLSLLLAKLGRIAEARANLVTAEASFRRAPKARGFALHLMLSAEVAIRAGHLPEARAWLEKVIDDDLTGSQLLDYYKVWCELAYASHDLEALRSATSSLKQYARVLAMQPWKDFAIVYEALAFELADEPEKALDTIAGLDPASVFGGRLALLYLRAGDVENAARASRAYWTWAQNSHNREDAWFAEIVRVRLDSAAPRMTLGPQLLQIETEARDNGHRRIELQAALARSQLWNDSLQIVEVRDQASLQGFARLAKQAARALEN
ncbi:MAG: protein kinase [Acidobacteriota bacterium]